MDSLSAGRIADVLAMLHQDAEAADRQLMADSISDGLSPEQMIKKVLEEEAKDYKALYGGLTNNFLSVSPAFGRFCYMCARL